MEYKDITKHPEILEYYEKGNQILEALGYTDHSTAHTKLVATRVLDAKFSLVVNEQRVL